LSTGNTISAVAESDGTEESVTWTLKGRSPVSKLEASVPLIVPELDRDNPVGKGEP
jgi:hypothetical protein